MPGARSRTRRCLRRADAGPLRRARPPYRDQARSDSGDRRRQIGGRAAALVADGQSPDDPMFGEEFGGTPAFSGSAVGARPDRRHQELRPRGPGVVHADRPAPSTASRGRRGQRTRARTALVGRRGRGRVRVLRRRERRISVSGVDDLDSASLSFSDLTVGWGEPRSRFIDLTDGSGGSVRYGDFWSYCLVAEGAVDIAAEPEVCLWDLAPIDILVGRPAGRSPTSRGGPATRRQCRRHQRTAPRGGADQADPA